MAGMPGGASKIQIPRWIQLVGLPLLLVFLWLVAGAARHVVFLFLVASLIALLLDPIVNAFTSFRLPRGFAVGIVFAAFTAAVILAIAALATVVVRQTKTASDRVNAYFTVVHGQPGHRQTNADLDVDRFQQWLDTHGLNSIQVQERGHHLVQQIRKKDGGKYTNKVVNFVEVAAISVGQLAFRT